MVGLVRDAVRRDVPLLGVCFGHQLLAWAVAGDGAVRLRPKPEVGWLPIEVTSQDPLLQGLGDGFTTFVSHSDEVVHREGLTVLARSVDCDVHAFRVGKKRAWGVQFHAEMGPEETESIVRSRAVRHPGLNIDPEEMIASRVNSIPLISSLFRNFFQSLEP